MAINSRFFDETKIIKKKITEQVTPQVPLEEVVPVEPVIEKTKKQTRKKKENVVEVKEVEQQPEPVQQVFNRAEQDYYDFIQKAIENEPEQVPPQTRQSLIEINMDTKPMDKPVYNYSLGNDGKAVIEPKRPAVAQSNPIQTNTDEKRTAQIMQMLEKTIDESIRLSIELQIQAQMIDLYEGAKKQTYENKVRTIQDEIKYNENRKVILEKMLSNK